MCSSCHSLHVLNFTLIFPNLITESPTPLQRQRLPMECPPNSFLRDGKLI